MENTILSFSSDSTYSGENKSFYQEQVQKLLYSVMFGLIHRIKVRINQRECLVIINIIPGREQ